MSMQVDVICMTGLSMPRIWGNVMDKIKIRGRIFGIASNQ